MSFRGVHRPESKTTPVRWVISGDNKDPGGKSTNDWFKAGVNVLHEIPNVSPKLEKMVNADGIACSEEILEETWKCFCKVIPTTDLEGSASCTKKDGYA
jgi:hypothetical protein